jgi:hypothetical protein
VLLKRKQDNGRWRFAEIYFVRKCIALIAFVHRHSAISAKFIKVYGIVTIEYATIKSLLCSLLFMPLFKFNLFPKAVFVKGFRTLIKVRNRKLAGTLFNISQMHYSAFDLC